MASNGWETVGRKKTKNVTKGQKKVSNVSDLTLSDGHIEVSDNSFKVFKDIEDRKQRQNNKTMNQNQMNEVIDKKVTKTKTKKKITVPNDSPESSRPSKPLTFEQLAQELKVVDFERVSEETKVKFPDMPLIWLKDIAYFLNERFSSVEPQDVTFADKPIDYPSIALPTNILDFINRNIRQCPQPIVVLIQEQLLQNLVKMNGPTMGFRIMLQCISSQYPDFTLKNIQKFIQQRNSYCNRQQICLTILWVASQSGRKSLKTGLNVWLDLMLPIIGQKAYTKFIIDSLGSLLELPSNAKQTEVVLNVNEFFRFYDFLFSPSNGLQMNFQKQLEILYHKIKLISYRNNTKREQICRQYFDFFFDRLDSELFVDNKNELLSELTYCLASDIQCYSHWRSLYSSHLTQSSQLMAYLSHNYKSLPSLSKDMLRKTVLSFRNTNEDSREQEKVLQVGHEACEVDCEALLNAMSGWKLPIKSLLMIFTVISALLLAYDTKSHGSFQKSFTGNLLKRTGTLPVVEQAYNKIETYSLIVFSWLSANLPVYCQSVNAVLSPYLTLFWAKFTEVMLYLWNSTEVLRVWINNTIPPILETITDEYVPKVTAIVWQTTSQLRVHLNTLWTFILKNSLIVSNWLQTNVLTGSLALENIQQVLIQAIDVLQTYVSEGYQWTTNQLKALIY